MPPREETADTNASHPEAQLALLINEGLRRKGMTVRKLSETSGIALKYLEHMSGGNTEKFPPAPYLRNYIIIIGRILDFNGQEVWNNIHTDELTVGSGKNDRLPVARRVLSSKKGIVWIAGVGALLAIYLLFRLPEVVGQPRLEIGFPTEAVSTVSVTPVTTIGSVKNGDEFFINGERVSLDENGFWQKDIALQEGMNTIELQAKKFLGQEIRVLRQIIYTPSASSSIKNTSSTNGGSSSSTENTTSSEREE
ncbi:MAG: helix-turn-helix domain-containing protein [Patescibacteria group bacterium]